MIARRIGSKSKGPLYRRICQILESARAGVARSVNTAQVAANWLIGREIVEEEQKGKHRAGYGQRLLESAAERLCKEYGTGYSARNLRFIRQFYLEYPDLLPVGAIRNALRAESMDEPDSARSAIWYAPRTESWKPGRLHPNISWTHYRTLLRVDKPEAR